MDVQQITDALDRVFKDENTRLVFWEDPEGEFVEHLSSIALEGRPPMRDASSRYFWLTENGGVRLAIVRFAGG